MNGRHDDGKLQNDVDTNIIQLEYVVSNYYIYGAITRVSLFSGKS